MALNKNFVVKNGVEVATNLIYAEGSVGKVGIGVTQPGAKLEVAGNIVGVALTLTGSTDGTDALYTGITTSNRGLDVGSGGTSIHVDVTNNSIGFNSTSPDTDFVLDVQPGVGQSAATFGGALDVQGNTWINGDLEVSGAIDGTFTINLDNTVITGVVTANDAEIYKQFDIINNSNIAYQFQSTGIGFTQNTDDPTLFLNRGEKYHFNLNATGHPFYIKTTRSTGSGDQYTAGVTNNGAQVGVVTFYVPYNAPSELFYQCGAHSGMGNTMYVLKDSPAGVSTETFVTDNLYVTGVSTFIGNARFDGDIDANGNIYLGDTETIYLGDANDLQIYHNGSNSYIDDSGTGSLIFKSNIYSFRNTGDSEQIAKFNENGSVELYYDNSKKLETTSTGITVTGTVSATSFNGSLTGNADTATNSTNVNLLARNTENATHYVTFGTSTTGNQRLNTDTGLTYNPSTNTLTATTFSGNATTATNTTNITVADESSDTTCFPVFTTAATGNLPPKSGTNLTFNSSTGQLTATSFSGNGSSLTNVNAQTLDSIDSSQFLRSDADDTATGTVTFNGVVNIRSALDLADNDMLRIGDSDDLQIYHNGSHSYIDDVGTGDLRIRANNLSLRNTSDVAYLYGNSGGSVLLYHNGSSKLETTSTGITVTGDVNSTSDINLKKDIEVVTSSTEMLNQLRGVKFTWKQNDERSVGVIAQEVEVILPELVKGEEGDKSVNYSGLVGVLIEAVKELSARVDELEKR
jgi:hypothetical protein